MFGLALEVLTLSFITMMNGISCLCLNIVHSHRDNEMEGRKTAHVFKGDVSPSALCSRQRRSQLGTHSSSKVSFYSGGEATARPWEKQKKTSWGQEEMCSFLQIEVTLWAGNHL